MPGSSVLILGDTNWSFTRCFLTASCFQTFITSGYKIEFLHTPSGEASHLQPAPFSPVIVWLASGHWGTLPWVLTFFCHVPQVNMEAICSIVVSLYQGDFLTSDRYRMHTSMDHLPGTPLFLVLKSWGRPLSVCSLTLLPSHSSLCIHQKIGTSVVHLEVKK